MLVETKVNGKNVEVRVGMLQRKVLEKLAKGPATRQELSAALEDAFIGCGCLGHISDKKKVEKGSLLAKGLVSFKQPKEDDVRKAAVYSITAAGKKIVEKKD